LGGGVLSIIGQTIDILLIIFLIVGCVLGCTLMRTLWLHVRFRSVGLEREQELLNLRLAQNSELPAVIVQIPTFNEGALIWRALAAAVALDWPRDKLHVQLLDDSTDESAEIARTTVAAYQSLGHHVTLVQRVARSGYKAGALKAGLGCSSEPFVAIFDVDYVPKPNFLRQCMPALLADSGLAFVQARCDFLNCAENWITRAQKVILDSHFGVEQVTRSWSGQVLPFNGTCGIWRRAAIDAAGGWQGDTLTEDLDLSYRAQLAGWHAIHIVSVSVQGELPATLHAWRKQQLRWNKGFAQSARKLLPVIWHGRFSHRRRVESTLHLAGCLYGVISVAQAVLWIIDLALGTISFPIVLPLVGFGLAQGLIGAMGLAILSRHLLRESETNQTRMGYSQTCATTVVTLFMHFYSGIVTAWGVLQGACGLGAPFERTPKQGTMKGEFAEDVSAVRSSG
jgi:cellulose synthase/poly-beta-1,6-N-acetylglucosamine synthase-like glycosyltransferase